MILEELIKINIDLGYKVDTIVIFKGQENMADLIAQKFCQKHGFDVRAQSALTAEINKNIASVQKQQNTQELLLTEIEEDEQHTSCRYMTGSKPEQKKLEEEGNLSVTESIAELHDSSSKEDKFHIFNVAVKQDYFQPEEQQESQKSEKKMPRVKSAAIKKVKRKRLVSPIHERLYRQNLECKDIQKRAVGEVEQKKSAFVPKLSTHTNNSLSITGPPPNVEQVMQNMDIKSQAALYNTMQNISPRINRNRQERLYAMLLDSECTFQPDLSKTLDRNNKKFSTINANDSRNQFLNTQKFQTLDQLRNPSRNKSTDSKKSKKSGKVFQRLAQSQLLYQARQKVLNRIRQSKEKFNPTTGEKNFRPKTTSNPKYCKDRPRSQSAVIKSLYDTHKTKKEKLEQEKNVQYEMLEQKRSSGSKANKKSDFIINKTKNQKLSEIYDALDSDNKGFITQKSMALHLFDAKLLEVLKPLFVTIHNSEQLIDKEKYLILAKKLYQILPQNEKNLILKFGKDTSLKDYHEETCTFYPRINYPSINRSKSPVIRAKTPFGCSIYSPKSSTMRSQIVTPKYSTEFVGEKQLLKKLSSQMKSSEDEQPLRSKSPINTKGMYSLSNTMKKFLNDEAYRNPFVIKSSRGGPNEPIIPQVVKSSRIGPNEQTVPLVVKSSRVAPAEPTTPLVAKSSPLAPREKSQLPFMTKNSCRVPKDSTLQFIKSSRRGPTEPPFMPKSGRGPIEPPAPENLMVKQIPSDIFMKPCAAYEAEPETQQSDLRIESINLDSVLLKKNKEPSDLRESTFRDTQSRQKIKESAREPTTFRNNNNVFKIEENNELKVEDTQSSIKNTNIFQFQRKLSQNEKKFINRYIQKPKEKTLNLQHKFKSD